jgi:hypothetical protein
MKEGEIGPNGGATMFKLISITIRLILIAAVLASVQKAAMPFRSPNGKGCSDSTTARTKGRIGMSTASSTESAGLLGLLSGKGIDLQGIGPMAALPKLMNLMYGHGAQMPELAASEKAAEPERPSGPTTVIRYNDVDSSLAKKPSASVTTLPPGASATIVDGRLQVFYPAGKKGSK